MNKSILSILCAFLLLVSCQKENRTDYTSMVNPFIGTGDHGHTFPGATAVNGMVQLSPDTRWFEWDACSGYHHTDSLINGFSHTHLSGTGIGDYGDILVMPIVGDVDLAKRDGELQNVPFASHFSHKTEKAVPGYYSVMLDRYNVEAELTASKRAGMHRYTFPKSDKSALVFDLDYQIHIQESKGVKIEKVSDTEIKGYKMTKGWAADQRVYFYAISSKPFTDIDFYQNDTLISNKDMVEGKSGKAVLKFSTDEKEPVLLKVGISSVDTEGAKLNLQKEIADWDFDKVATETRKEWNKYLSKVDVQTTNDSLKTIFYTAMYHSAIAPNIFSDVDGRYRGMDGKTQQSDNEQYTVFSTWDTMRALHPLMTIISPAKNQAFIRSLLQKYKEGGTLPMWELAGNYTATMIGYNSVPIIADSYMKGERDFDTDLAYKAMLQASNYDTTGIIAYSPAFLNGLMPMSKKYKNEIGYIPCETELESVAKGLEYAFQDWCILQVAKDKKDSANILKYSKLANNYKNYFDKSTGFMRGKHKDGSWRTPFNPRSSNHRSDDYCEGTAWQWLWFVPQDPDSLMNLLGGKKNFIEKLDGLFAANSEIEGKQTSVDISGLIGQYAHGNEPSHHIIHLYNYVDEPYKTQELTDSVLFTLYANRPAGLSGNEDCGQMSAWYVLNAMGFYQVCPGNPTYSIGRPIFDDVTLNLENGKKFEIVTKNNSRKNKYIKSITLNGKQLEKPFFTHSDIMNGGKMEIEMTDSKL